MSARLTLASELTDVSHSYQLLSRYLCVSTPFGGSGQGRAPATASEVSRRSFPPCYVLVAVYNALFVIVRESYDDSTLRAAIFSWSENTHIHAKRGLSPAPLLPSRREISIDAL